MVKPGPTVPTRVLADGPAIAAPANASVAATVASVRVICRIVGSLSSRDGARRPRRRAGPCGAAATTTPPRTVTSALAVQLGAEGRYERLDVVAPVMAPAVDEERGRAVD